MKNTSRAVKITRLNSIIYKGFITIRVLDDSEIWRKEYCIVDESGNKERKAKLCEITAH